jgi:hypothetical protein
MYVVTVSNVGAGEGNTDVAKVGYLNRAKMMTQQVSLRLNKIEQCQDESRTQTLGVVSPGSDLEKVLWAAW